MCLVIISAHYHPTAVYRKKTSITYRHLFHIIHNIVYSQHPILGSLAAERWSAANPSEVLGLSVDVFPDHWSALEPWIYHTRELRIATE